MVKKKDIGFFIILAVVLLLLYKFSGADFLGSTISASAPLIINDVTGVEVNIQNTPEIEHFSSGFNRTVRLDWTIYLHELPSTFVDSFGKISYSNGWILSDVAAISQEKVFYMQFQRSFSGYQDFPTLQINDGDYIRLTHNNGVTDIYLPNIEWGANMITLYVSEDGSTYYDAGLTNLAKDSGVVIDTEPTCISNQELLDYISDWVDDLITNQELLDKISLWVNC